MKAIHLEDNAFASAEESFLPVDIDKEQKSLQKKGTANGKTNFPSADTVQLDEVEQDIVLKVARTAQQTRSALSQHFTDFRGRLLPIVEKLEEKALINKIQEMPHKTEGELNGLFNQFETDAAIRGGQWRNAQKDFDDFRKENKLIRPADYSPTHSIVFLFVIMILTEAILNATLLWELTGILWGIGQTLLITAVNVLLGGSGMGLLFRYKNCVSAKLKLLTLLCFVIIPSVLVFNLGVGHYRDALVEEKSKAGQLQGPLDWDAAGYTELDFVDYTQQAMERIKDSFFGVDSIVSALFIIVGIGFFAFASYKWYSMLDIYPGYKKRDVMLKKSHEGYKNLVDTYRGKITKTVDDAINRVVDERTQVTNMRKEYDNLINRANSLKIDYANWALVLGRTQNALLAEYRSSNKKARSESAPKHFNDTTLIDEELVTPPDFTPSSLGDTDAVVEAVKLAEGRIHQITEPILSRFNQLANMTNETG